MTYHVAGDIVDEIKFALITDPALVASLNLSSQSNIHLVTWNHTAFFPEEEITAESIAKWIRGECTAGCGTGLRWMTPGMLHFFHQ